MAQQETKMRMHTITKLNGDEVIFFTDFDYSDESVVEKILKQAMGGDCGDFLQGSSKWAMDMWTKGNPTGYMWALKIAADIRQHIKSRITLKNLYKFFKESDTTVTEVPVKDRLIIRLSWDKDREWIWVKRLFPVRYGDRSYDSVCFGAIWEDGVYRQLSRNSMSEEEAHALKAFNMKPKQQWADKRSWIRYDELFDNDEQEDKERMQFASQEEAERYQRQRRVEAFLANEDVNSRYRKLTPLTDDQRDALDDLNADREASAREAEREDR